MSTARTASDQEDPSVGRNSVIMATGTAASRVTGQIRTILLAAAIGTTGIAADAYQTGAMIPQVMFTLISGGIFNAVLVPQIVRTLKEQDAEERLNKLITASIALLAVLTLILMLGTSVLTSIYLNSKWNPAQRALANAFTLWCMPQVFFYGLYTVLGQILAAKGRFTAYAWSSVGANLISCVGFIVFIEMFGNAQHQAMSFWTSEKVGLTAGAWTLGVAFQALVLFIPLIRSGFTYRPRWGLRGIGLRSMGPVAAWSLGVVVIDQLANIVNARITNGAPLEGDPFQIAGNGSYQNAYTLYMLPYSLIAVSVSTAIFPRLSQSIADDRIDDARQELSRALRNVGLIMCFFSVVMLVIPVPIIRALLPSVSVHEAVLISGPLMGLSVGLVAVSAFLLIQRTFYAFEDGKQPFVFAAISNLVQVVIVLVAIRLAPAQYWTALVGLSLALSNILSFPLLVAMLKRRFAGSLDGRRIITSYSKALLAALVCAGLALLVKTPLTHLLGAQVDGREGHMSWVQAVVICALTTALVGLVYCLVLSALHTDELTTILVAVSQRFGLKLPLPAGARQGKLAARTAGSSTWLALSGIEAPASPTSLSQQAGRIVRSYTDPSAAVGLESALEQIENSAMSDAGSMNPRVWRQPVRIVPNRPAPESKPGKTGPGKPNSDSSDRHQLDDNQPDKDQLDKDQAESSQTESGQAESGLGDDSQGSSGHPGSSWQQAAQSDEDLGLGSKSVNLWPSFNQSGAELPKVEGLLDGRSDEAAAGKADREEPDKQEPSSGRHESPGDRPKRVASNTRVSAKATNDPSPSLRSPSSPSRIAGGRVAVSKVKEAPSKEPPAPKYTPSPRPAPKSILLDRYELKTAFRQELGISAWLAQDKALERTCQLFVVTDGEFAMQVGTAASALALAATERFTPVYQMHLREGVTVVATAIDPGASIRDFLRQDPKPNLSYEAVRTIIGEVSQAILTLREAGINQLTVCPDLVRLAPRSVSLADAPICSMIEPWRVGKSPSHEGREALVVHQLAAILYCLVTGDIPDQEDQLPTLAALPADLPEDFRIICERGLELTSFGKESPIPLVTLAELIALLGPWKSPAELDHSDIVWPGNSEHPSIESVALQEEYIEDIIPLPPSLLEADKKVQKTLVEPKWAADQLLFPESSEIEMIKPEDSNVDLFSLFAERRLQKTDTSYQRQRFGHNPWPTIPVKVGAAPGPPAPSNDPANAPTSAMPLIPGTGEFNPVPLAGSRDEDDEASQDQKLATRVRPVDTDLNDAPDEPILTQEAPALEEDKQSYRTPPPSFIPEKHLDSGVFPVQEADESKEKVVLSPVVPDDDEDSDDEVADQKLFGRFTIRSVAIALGALIVVIALVWASLSLLTNRSKESADQEEWPLASQSTPSKKPSTKKAPPSQSPSVTASPSSPTPSPSNTNPYEIATQAFLTHPANQDGVGWYVHLSQAQKVSRLVISIRQNNGHGSIYANVSSEHPTNGSSLADFTFDPSGTTTVTFKEPVETQDLMVWVPTDGLPQDKLLHFNEVKVF